jgi:hypothetical protein
MHLHGKHGNFKEFYRLPLKFLVLKPYNEKQLQQQAKIVSVGNRY